MTDVNEGRLHAQRPHSPGAKHGEPDQTNKAELAMIWLAAQTMQQRRLETIRVEMEALGLEWIPAPTAT
jgi:hypothetical protein